MNNSILKLRNFILHFIAKHSFKTKDKVFSIVTVDHQTNRKIKTINYFTFENDDLIVVDVIPKKHQLIGILEFQLDGNVSYTNIIKNKFLDLSNYIQSLYDYIINEFKTLGINTTVDKISIGSINTENDVLDIIRVKDSDICLIY